MKSLSLSLSILLAAKAALAVPPGDCDDVCGRAKDWSDCINQYKQDSWGRDGLSQTADQFCTGKGFKNDVSRCKRCQYNHLPTPSRRALAARSPQRNADLCVDSCGGPDPTNAKWHDGCEGLCSRGGGPNKPSAGKLRSVPPPPLPDKCRLLNCWGMPKNEWNDVNNCAKLCSDESGGRPNKPSVGKLRPVPPPPLPDLCALKCRDIPVNEWNDVNNCANICSNSSGGHPNKPSAGKLSAEFPPASELVHPPPKHWQTLTLEKFQKECARLRCGNLGDDQRPRGANGIVWADKCNICRGDLASCLSANATTVAADDKCNNVNWPISSECGETKCKATESCVVTKCPTTALCGDKQYTSSPICVDLENYKQCGNSNNKCGEGWTCQIHAHFAADGTDVGLGNIGELQARGFCQKI